MEYRLLELLAGRPAHPFSRNAILNALREVVSPHVDEYIRHLLDELGDPPTPDRAARLAQRLPLVIHLLGAEPWSSAGSPPESSSRSSVTRTLADGTEVTLARGQDGFVLRAQRGDVGVVLMPRDPRRADKAPLAVGLRIAGVLLVLMLAHHRIRRLFRPIETLRAGIARIGGGGVDLYLSRAIAQAHSGRLEMEIRSTPDRGTRVKVCIPISDDEV